MFRIAPGQTVTLIIWGVHFTDYPLKNPQSFDRAAILIDPFGRLGVHPFTPSPTAALAQKGFYGFKIEFNNQPGILFVHHSNVKVLT